MRFAFEILVVAGLCAGCAGCDSHPDVDFEPNSPGEARTPFVVFTNPASQALDVDPDGTLVVVFSTSMNPATVTEANLVLSSGSTVVETSISYSGFTARVTPVFPLAAPAPYHLSISDSIESSAGIRLSSDLAVGFSTGSAYPFFSVRKSDAQSIGTTNTLVTWDIVDADDMGSDLLYGWGPQPNSYVVPVTGWWSFTVSLGIDATQGDRLFVAVADDNSGSANARAYLAQTHADTTAQLSAGGTVVLYLAQGAEVSVLARSEVSTSPASDTSYHRFQGQLVRR